MPRNLENRRKWERDNYQNKKEIITAQRNFYHKKYPEQTRFNNLKGSAKYRDIEMTLSFQDYIKISSQPCFYCGGVLPAKGHGLDRINSNTGYVFGNVRPCCTRCNQAKSNMSTTEFQQWILSVFNNWAGKVA